RVMSNGSLKRCGFTVRLPVAARTSVYPSGFASAPSAMPMFPDAPGRLSTMTGCFHFWDRCRAITRASGSATPPDGKGTTMCTGLDGYMSWAWTGTAVRRANRAHGIHFMHLFYGCFATQRKVGPPRLRKLVVMQITSSAKNGFPSEGQGR